MHSRACEEAVNTTRYSDGVEGKTEQVINDWKVHLPQEVEYCPAHSEEPVQLCRTLQSQILQFVSRPSLARPYLPDTRAFMSCFSTIKQG